LMCWSSPIRIPSETRWTRASTSAASFIYRCRVFIWWEPEPSAVVLLNVGERLIYGRLRCIHVASIVQVYDDSLGFVNWSVSRVRWASTRMFWMWDIVDWSGGVCDDSDRKGWYDVLSDGSVYTACLCQTVLFGNLKLKTGFNFFIGLIFKIVISI
jgi:hypothetical protein